MAAEILPDGSILFRLTETSILFDVRRESVIVEDLAGDPSEADTAFHRPFGTAVVVWLACRIRTKPRLSVLFRGDDSVDLGLVPDQESGLQLACELGNLMGCPVEVDDTGARPRAEAQARSGSRKIDPLEQETQRISYGPLSSSETTARIADPPGRARDDIDDPIEEIDELSTDATWEPVIEDLTDLFIEERGAEIEDPALLKRETIARHLLGRERARPNRDKRRIVKKRRAEPHRDSRDPED